MTLQQILEILRLGPLTFEKIVLIIDELKRQNVDFVCLKEFLRTGDISYLVDQIKVIEDYIAKQEQINDSFSFGEKSFDSTNLSVIELQRPVGAVYKPRMDLLELADIINRLEKKGFYQQANILSKALVKIFSYTVKQPLKRNFDYILSPYALLKEIQQIALEKKVSVQDVVRNFEKFLPLIVKKRGR